MKSDRDGKKREQSEKKLMDWQKGDITLASQTRKYAAPKFISAIDEWQCFYCRKFCINLHNKSIQIGCKIALLRLPIIHLLIREF